MSNTTLVTTINPILYTGGTISQASSTSTPKSESKAQQENKSAIIIDGFPPITDTNFGFIEKIKDEKGQYYFYVAGLSELATKSAASYLWNKWFSLHKSYGNGESFFILLRFDNWETNEYTVLLERELL